MRNLEIYFDNPFWDKKITNSRLNAFGKDHINRLTDNNPDGKYSDMITATKARHEGYFGKMVLAGDSTALRISKTANVVGIVDQIKSLIAQKEGTIRGIWEKDHPVYLEFYPFGITEYRNATRDGIISLLDRYILAIGRHITELPANFKTSFSDLRTAYSNERDEQMKKKGDVSDNKNAASNLRQEFEHQLFLNLLQISYDYAGHSEMLRSYFDPSVLHSRSRKNGEKGDKNEALTGKVGTNSSVQITQGTFTPDTVIMLQNLGTVPLKFYTAKVKTDPVPDTTFELFPGEKEEVTPAELGAENNNLLMVFNASESVEGQYSCQVY